ncbi:uncharacterized protein LOC123988229 [Osmia bicornis bicornis]|uniref:uncharacterized protein LOC123988229 n=1 Tax=Osmia bicornis bicornis TaxID=1437191 RepID=UPI001EAED85B|nr:uncharacterized protein LOC123988229 [Osmia bicornis bicornis]
MANSMALLTQRNCIQFATAPIPTFDGENPALSVFAQSVENGLALIPDTSETEYLSIVLTKLTGPARISIQDKQFNNVTQLLQHLKKRYAPGKNLAYFQAEVSRLKIREDESLRKYIDRASKLAHGSRIAIRERYTTNVDQLIKEMEMDILENFLEGLPERVAWRIAALDKKIKTLEEAYEAVLQIERRLKNRRQIQEKASPSRRREEDFLSWRRPREKEHRRVYPQSPSPYRQRPRDRSTSGSEPEFEERASRATALTLRKHDYSRSPNHSPEAPKYDEPFNTKHDVYDFYCANCSTVGHGWKDCEKSPRCERPRFQYRRESRGNFSPLRKPLNSNNAHPNGEAEGAEISYYHKTLVTRNQPIKPIFFSNAEEMELHPVLPIKHRLPGRTALQIAVPVANPEVMEGYLARIKTPEQVYIGEAAVCNHDGICYVLATNTGEDEIEIDIEPQRIHPYEIFDSSDDDPIPSYLAKETKEDRTTRIQDLLRTDHLNSEERQHVFKIVREFSDRFFLPGDNLGKVPNFHHSIYTTDDIPINTRQYRYPPVHQEEIQRQVGALLSQGIIRPSTSPYNSPLWIVPKKPDADGNKRWRMVIDFRALNEKTTGDKFPLPNIPEILDKVGGAKYFSIFDLANGFHQIEMNPKDRQKTAFTTPHGHFEFVRMPFGLKNAPPTFQRVMNRVTSGLENVLVFIDDMIVFSSSLREHEIKVKKLFDRLREYGLTLQTNKCEFLRKEVAYLGHILSADGVKPDPRKLHAVKNFPIPKTQKNVQQFLGLTGYYRRFIKDYSLKAKPLVQLLGKGTPFQWTEEQQGSFELLCKELCTQPILQYPDFERPFVITTDASDHAIGAEENSQTTIRPASTVVELPDPPTPPTDGPDVQGLQPPLQPARPQTPPEYLKHYMNSYEDWDLYLPFATLSYNTSVHEATNFTPHELIFGKPARQPSSFPEGEELDTYGTYLTHLITRLTETRNIAADNLNTAKDDRNTNRTNG